MEVAVLNSSKLENADVAYMAAACDAQAQEAWNFWGGMPGLSPLNVVSYASAALLPAADVYICEIVDALDQPGALGYHSDDLAGRPYLRVLAQGAQTSITLSHEVLETLVDPTCDGWRARGDGTQVALEVCDPVEGDSYPVSVTVISGPPRQVQVSNYVLPAWFGTAAARVDRMGTAAGPFAMTAGGYMVVLDSAGNENDVFARLTGSLAGLATAGKRLAVGNSRLLRRLRGRPQTVHMRHPMYVGRVNIP